MTPDRLPLAGPAPGAPAGLFILGGAFGYFVAFRYGLTFLLGLGRDNNITPMVSVSEYFDLFVNVMLGIGLVFELPILIFFLTLLHIVTPSFLIRNSRYAILAIFIIAAIVTPTPDVFNLMLFATPMALLFPWAFSAVTCSFCIANTGGSRGEVLPVDPIDWWFWRGRIHGSTSWGTIRYRIGRFSCARVLLCGDKSVNILFARNMDLDKVIRNCMRSARSWGDHRVTEQLNDLPTSIPKEVVKRRGRKSMNEEDRMKCRRG